MKLNKRLLFCLAVGSSLLFSLTSILWAGEKEDRQTLLQRLSGYHNTLTKNTLDQDLGDKAPALLMSIVNAKQDPAVSAFTQRRALLLLGSYQCREFPNLKSFLLNQINDPLTTPQWKNITLTVLGSACKEEAVQSLIPFLSSSDPWIRDGAAKGLGAAESP